jgi:aminomuconate-semialdehyde/2-hydroxymuconate-6-semialdehyde dehydrogenase
MARPGVGTVSDGFDWLEKDRAIAKRDMARAYGFVKRQAAATATPRTAKSEPRVEALGNFIANKFVPAKSKATLEDRNPATGEIIASIPRSDVVDVEAAVTAARKALPAWSKKSVAARCKVLERIGNILERDQERIASIESRDTGKPIALARKMDAARAVRNFRFFADFARHWKDAEHVMDGFTNVTVRRPVGVVGLITPWNLPIYLLTWKLAPALAMGNTVVAKPSELTPLSADALCRVLKEAGLPAGVFNLVHGLGGEAGQALVEHPDVRAISFTGGTATGAKVAEAAAPHFKKISLELGGKNPSIVFADCDLDAAVAGVVRAGFTNQGQVCLCGSRILVEASLADRFTKRLVKSVDAMRLGDPARATTELGSLITPEHRAKVEAYVAIARRDGGTILCGGGRPSLPPRLAKGAFLEPTVITGLSQDSACIQEEIFGPVVTVQTFKTQAEAVKLANGVRYGLAATVWTRDATKARRVAEALESGMVWVNDWLVRDLRVPFGGMKASGVGREGGAWSLEFFSEARNICVPTPKTPSNRR